MTGPPSGGPVYIRDMTDSVDTCIVGSGLGGLSIARRLEAEGTDYVVLDKGRSPGGRAGTRRFAESRFDHGLPWLTEKGPLTRELIGRGLQAGVLSELEDAGNGEPAWFSAAGISSVGKHLAKGLKVRNRVRVTGIAEEDGHLNLTTETDGEESGIRVRRNLFVTAPLPQALDLMEPLLGSSLRPDAEPFEKCIVAMVAARPDSIPASGRVTVIPDHLKFPDVEPGFSVRFSAEDSEQLFDADEDRIKAFVNETLGTTIPPEQIQLMKWRYANGSGAVREPFFEAEAGAVSIAICGDAFFGGTATGTEASLMSCHAAYDALA